MATHFRAVVNSEALLFRMKTKAAHDELVPVLAAEDPGLEQLAWRGPYKSLEFKADVSLSGWRDWAAEGTTSA